MLKKLIVIGNNERVHEFAKIHLFNNLINRLNKPITSNKKSFNYKENFYCSRLFLTKNL